jgi:hypothetical protein
VLSAFKKEQLWRLVDLSSFQIISKPIPFLSRIYTSTGRLVDRVAPVDGMTIQSIQTKSRRAFKRTNLDAWCGRPLRNFSHENGSDLLVDCDQLRNTPDIGRIAMRFINVFRPITMDYLCIRR